MKRYPVAYLVKRGAVLAMAAVCLYASHRWLVSPFLYQSSTRQLISVMCDQSPVCKDVDAVKVIDIESGRIERRLALVLKKGANGKASSELRLRAVAAIEQQIEDATIFATPSLKGMLPIEVKYE